MRCSRESIPAGACVSKPTGLLTANNGPSSSRTSKSGTISGSLIGKVEFIQVVVQNCCTNTWIQKHQYDDDYGRIPIFGKSALKKLKNDTTKFLHKIEISPQISMNRGHLLALILDISVQLADNRVMESLSNRKQKLGKLAILRIKHKINVTCLR